jgi:hypothetical protein
VGGHSPINGERSIAATISAPSEPRQRLQAVFSIAVASAGNVAAGVGEAPYMTGRGRFTETGP